MPGTTLDAPLRFVLRADEAQWQATESLFKQVTVTDLAGRGCWRVLEIDASTPREVEAALEEVLRSLGAGWPDVIAVGPA